MCPVGLAVELMYLPLANVQHMETHCGGEIVYEYGYTTQKPDMGI